MKKKYFVKYAYILAFLALVYYGYRWDQARKLDNYFIDQICLDAYVQNAMGKPCLNGPIFDQACVEMKELRYNPYEIQQIVFKGYKKALVKQEKLRKAEEFLADSK